MDVRGKEEPDLEELGSEKEKDGKGEEWVVTLASSFVW